MKVVDIQFVKSKKVLLRYDIDVALRLAPLAQGKPAEDGAMEVAEDFKLKAGLDTLKLCLENASKVIIIGHLGRPFKTVEDEEKGNPPELSAKPIQKWFESHLRSVNKLEAGVHFGGEAKVDFARTLEEAEASDSKIVLLENIRFFHGEVPGLDYHTTCTSKTCDIDFARKLAALADVYVNEAFSSYNKGASTTIVPTLFPPVKDPEGRLRPRRAAGLHFAKEVEILTKVRNNPKKPFIVIMGGAKVADKLPVITVLAEKADAVLVGGKLIAEIREQQIELPKNVLVGMLNEDGLDIAPQTTAAWSNLISRAAMIVWNGPLGRIEKNTWKVSKDFTFQVEKLGSAKSTYEIAKMILNSHAQIVVGGGDTVAFLGSLGLLGEYEKKAFVSVGGGAMLKLLSDGTLLTIQALQ